MYKLIDYSHTLKEFAKVDDLYCNVSSVRWDHVIAELSMSIPNKDFENLNDVIEYIRGVAEDSTCLKVCINSEECIQRFNGVQNKIKELV